MTIEEIKSKIVPILKQKIKNEMSLLDFVQMKLELEEAINRKVGLVEYETIKPLIKEKILSEQVAIL